MTWSHRTCYFEPQISTIFCSMKQRDLSIYYYFCIVFIMGNFFPCKGYIHVYFFNILNICYNSIGFSDFVENMSLSKIIHANCINKYYPFCEIKRLPLTREQIPWTFSFSSYNPPEYNSKVLINKPWADPPLGNFLEINIKMDIIFFLLKI